MHCAANQGHSSIVEVLIRSHADVNAASKVSECITTHVSVHVQIAIDQLHILYSVKGNHTVYVAMLHNYTIAIVIILTVCSYVTWKVHSEFNIYFRQSN